VGFSELTNFPEVLGGWRLGVEGLDYMPDVGGDSGVARSPYEHSLPLYMMETRMMTWVELCIQHKLCNL